MEQVEIKSLLDGLEISNKMDRYTLVSEFLKQAGRQLYIKEIIGESPSSEDIKMFTDKLNEFREYVDKLCTLPVKKT